ncbi:MAG: nucleotidyltransferase family protein [Vicinamibacterales bacterium]
MSERAVRHAPGGSWPDRRQSLLLRAALLEGAAAAAAWREWADGTVSPQPQREATSLEWLDAGSVRLLPLAYENLIRLGEPLPLLRRMRGVHRHAWCRNQLLFRRVAEVIASLEQSGVPSLLLKGVPLAIAHYGSAAARPMADVDLLVHPGDVPGAVRVLARLGWRPVEEPSAWPPEPLASWAFVNDDRQETDLHWRVFAESYRPDDRLWTRSEPLTVHGTPARALAAPEQLLHVLVHGIKWNPVPSIRWIPDAVAVIRRAGDGFDWDELLDLAERLQFQPILQVGLAYLRSMFDVTVPRQVVRFIEERPMTRHERVALAARTRPGPMAAAYRVWCDYRRFAADRQHRLGPDGLRRYLQGAWQVDSARALGSVAAGKLASRLRHARHARGARSL